MMLLVLNDFIAPDSHGSAKGVSYTGILSLRWISFISLALFSSLAHHMKFIGAAVITLIHLSFVFPEHFRWGRWVIYDRGFWIVENDERCHE